MIVLLRLKFGKLRAHTRKLNCTPFSVVYRDFDENETLVLSRKIRKQPICGMQGAVPLVQQCQPPL